MLVGLSDVKMAVRSEDDGIAEGRETATATVVAGDGYIPDPVKFQSTITIDDTDVADRRVDVVLNVDLSELRANLPVSANGWRLARERFGITDEDIVGLQAARNSWLSSLFPAPVPGYLNAWDIATEYLRGVKDRLQFVRAEASRLSQMVADPNASKQQYLEAAAAVVQRSLSLR